MYFLNFIITFFIASFFSTYGNPVSRKIVEEMKFSENDPNFKCPYVRKTKLLEPEPEFLSKCASFQAAQSITKLNTENVQDALCLLYYDDFINLCYLSNNFSITPKILSNEKIDEVVKTYRSGNEVCEVLKNAPVFSYHTKMDVIEMIRKDLEVDKKCERICTDLDDLVKPVCIWTASMIHITKELFQQSQNVVSSEKGATTKTKPSLTEHNEDAAGTKQNSASSPQQNTKSNAPLLKKDQDNSAKHQNFETQVNSQSQNEEILETNQNSLPQPGSSTKQPPIVLKESAPAAPVNNESGNHVEQQEIKEENVIQVQTTLVVPQTEVKDKSEEKEKIVGVQQNEAGSQTSNNLNASHKKSENSKETSENIQPPPVEDSSNLQKQTDVGHEETDVTKTEKKPAGENIPQLELPEESGNIGEQMQGDKLSTKNDDGIAYNNQMLPDSPDDDLDMDSPQANEQDGDFNSLVEPLPKSDEVKTKPVEKSKPLETDEDGPSFAANYQNQNLDDSDSYFFSYFMMVCIMFICGYVAYHNKQKILALVVEGRKGRRPSRTRRPNSANYRKLDSNLEEAVTSSCNKNATQVIY